MSTDTVDSAPFADEAHTSSSHRDSLPDSLVNLSSTQRIKSSQSHNPNPLSASTNTTISSSATPSSRRRRHSYQPTTLYGDAAPAIDAVLAEAQLPDGPPAATPSPAPQSDTGSTISAESPIGSAAAVSAGGGARPAAVFSRNASDRAFQLQHRRRTGSLLSSGSSAAPGTPKDPTGLPLPARSTRRSQTLTSLPDTENLQDWKTAATQLLKQWEYEKRISTAYRHEYGALTGATHRTTHSRTPSQMALSTPPNPSLRTPSPDLATATTTPTSASHGASALPLPHPSKTEDSRTTVESLQIELQQSQQLQKELAALLAERDEAILKLRNELDIAKTAAASASAHGLRTPSPAPNDEPLIHFNSHTRRASSTSVASAQTSLGTSLKEAERRLTRPTRGSLSASGSAASPPHPPKQSTSTHDSSLLTTGNGSGRLARVRRLSTKTPTLGADVSGVGGSSRGGGGGVLEDLAGTNASLAGVSPLSTTVMSPSPPPGSPNGTRLDASGSFRRHNNTGSPSQPQQHPQLGRGEGSTSRGAAATGATPSSVLVPTLSPGGVSAEEGRQGTAEETFAPVQLPSADSPSLFTTASSLALPHVLGVSSTSAATTRQSGAEAGASDTSTPTAAFAQFGSAQRNSPGAGTGPGPAQLVLHPSSNRSSASGGAPLVYAASMCSLSNSPSVSSFMTPTLGALTHTHTGGGGGFTHGKITEAAPVAPRSPAFTRVHRAPVTKSKPTCDAASAGEPYTANLSPVSATPTPPVRPVPAATSSRKGTSPPSVAAVTMTLAGAEGSSTTASGGALPKLASDAPPGSPTRRDLAHTARGASSLASGAAGPTREASLRRPAQTPLHGLEPIVGSPKAGSPKAAKSGQVEKEPNQDAASVTGGAAGEEDSKTAAEGADVDPQEELRRWRREAASLSHRV